MSTLPEHVSTLQAFSSFSWCALSACVDTLKSCVNTWSSILKDLASISMCRHLNVMCRHLQFQFCYRLHVSTLWIHVSTLSIHWTLPSCVNTSNPIFLLSICVDSFTRCVNTLIPRFESMLTVFMCHTLAHCVDTFYTICLHVVTLQLDVSTPLISLS